MKKLALLLLSLIVTTTLFAQKQTEKPEFTDALKIYGLSKLCSEVKYNFVYYDQLTFNWDSLCLASIPVILATKNENEYYKEMQRICAHLGDGHTSVFPYKPSDENDVIKSLPFVTKLFGNRIFVREVYSTELQKKGLDKGAEILKINGKNAYTYGKEEVMPFISSSTPQWTEYRTFCCEELTEGRRGDIMKIEYKDVNGKVHTLDLDKRKLEWDKDNSDETFHFKILPGEIAYLRITDFMGDTFAEQFDEIYKQIPATKGWIIDLRDNTGGNSNYADYILRHMSEKPFKSSQWSTRMYRPAYASWGYPEEWFLQSAMNLSPVRNKEIYTKPVTVLINSGTYSSAEDFCIKFQGMKRGKIIGVPSGGSTGNPIGATLVKGVLGAAICSKKDVGPDGTVFVGVGIIPDIKAEMTMEDFLSEKDELLDIAIKTLGEDIR